MVSGVLWHIAEAMTKSSRDNLNLNIRLLNSADFSMFWPVRLLALQESPHAFGASYEESLAMSEQEAVSRLSPKDGGFILGAFADQLVGIAGLARQPGIKVRHKATIWGVYVVPTARGRGIARLLFEDLLARCQAVEGLEEVVLSVVTTNQAAKELYLSLGFEVYGLEKRALKVDNEYFDEELMTRAIT
jgi:ribosomal protein S18 acetylase RimI-like enzyme